MGNKKLTNKQRKFLIKNKDSYPLSILRYTIPWILQSGEYTESEATTLNNVITYWHKNNDK